MLLEGIDWVVRPGERWAMIGPNGAGKTTLLTLAGAEGHPSEGTARVLGHALGAVDVRALRAAIGHVDATMAARFRLGGHRDGGRAHRRHRLDRAPARPADRRPTASGPASSWR